MKKLIFLFALTCFCVGCTQNKKEKETEVSELTVEEPQEEEEEEFYYEDEEEEELNYLYSQEPDEIYEQIENDDYGAEESPFENYEETSNCVVGYVVYEGRKDMYIVETQAGFSVIEWYGGNFLDEDTKIRGPLNSFGFCYIIDEDLNETRIYIEDYMLTEEQALEILGKNNSLKATHQDMYDNY